MRPASPAQWRGGRGAARLAHGVVALACASFCWGQQDPVVVIRAVEFPGLSPAATAVASGTVQVRAGAVLSRERLEDDVIRLVRTGRFTGVRYETVEEPDGVVVRFLMQERRLVRSIRFDGRRNLKESKLKEAVVLKEGDAVDPFSLRRGQEGIVDAYRREAYTDVLVMYDEAAILASGDVVFTIVEGPRSRIREIRFEGVASIPEEVLRGLLETRTAWWLFRVGAFDEAAAERDAARLQQHYRDQGFLDARVTYRRDVTRDGADIVVVFIAEEGTRYLIEQISITGNTVYTVEDLQRLLGSREGDFVLQRRLDGDVQAIQRYYGEYGYIYCGVRAVRVFSETPGFVKVTLEINEGDQYRVGDVIIRGNARTRDRVVRRTLDLYPPDDLLNMSAVRQAEESLKATGIFTEATRVYPAGTQPGVRDVIMDVQEAEKAGDFIFGAGVSSNSGIVGTIVLDFNNFDITDTPRNWSEFWRFRSFHGGGQRLRLELQPGTEVSRYRIDFVEPYLFEKPLRFTTSAYLFERGREVDKTLARWNEQRIGANVGLSRRVRRGMLEGWDTDVRARLEQVRIDSEVFSARDIHKADGSNLLAGVQGGLTLDRTDNRILPTRGDRLRFAYEQVAIVDGSDIFGKATVEYARYYTLHRDILDRASVLSLSGEMGFILGSAPVYERFYAGGTGSMRGFAFRGVGPRKGIDENNVGGDFLVLMSGEYSFPLYEQMVRGFVFTDMGTVEDGLTISDWRASVGFGVRLVIDVLGRIPMEFAVGVPVLKGDGDDDQLFSFSISKTF